MSMLKPIALSAFMLVAATSTAAEKDRDLLERGRYLTRIAGCNDCHSAGYAPSGGRLPEQDWLTGDSIGWSGPWGTTYPTNLRLLMAKLTEDEWLKLARNARSRPPMPWFALRDMSETDLRALYHFIRALGPAGVAAPAYVPPGQTIAGPVIQFPAPPN